MVKLEKLLKAVTPEGKDFLEDTVSWVPLNPIELNTEKEKEQLQRLLDLLEEDDDVQDVYHNIVGLEPEEAEEE
ncbi:MAG: YebC/PmpR family DNA-binding transcriptional regulator [Bacilli bacterium]